MQQGNYDEALRDFDRVIDLAPELAAAYSSRGSVWIQKGEHDKADADFQQAIACEPGMAEAFVMERLLLEAAYYGRQEEFDEAIGRATEAIETGRGVPAGLRDPRRGALVFGTIGRSDRRLTPG